MDLLLSVPVASYFLTPTSFSTSLNILFFYMTWTTLVLSHPPLVVHLVGVLAIRVVFALIPGLVSLLLDGALPSLVENIKHGGRSALPPTDPYGFARVLALSLLNVALVTLAEAAASSAYKLAFLRPEFKTTSTLPLPWYMAKHVIALFLARELLLYSVHRYLLHAEDSDSRLVRYLSRQHARFAHPRAAPPYILQIFTDHPLAYLLHRWVPVYLPALVLRPHLLTYFLFVALCTGEETMGMSGYSIVPGIIMGGIARRTAIHYATQGEANYGPWGVSDWVNGSSQGKNVLEDVRAEADKHHLEQRASRKAGQGVNLLQDGMDALRSNGDSLDEPRKSGRKRAASKKSKEN